MKIINQTLRWTLALLTASFLCAVCVQSLAAQDQQDWDQQDDPPSRVARLGYMEGSISMQPAGESEWVQADQNRPMTTGDKLWADQDSRAELQLGSAMIDLDSNTGFSFLNLDDRTVQIQLTSGAVNVRVRELNRDDVFEIDTPNQAFSIFAPGRYRVEASEDGTYTVVSIREGQGESTGNGQTFTLRAGQRGTFEGTDSLNAQVEQIGGPDAFDNWSYSRDQRYENSPSARYVSRDMVGYQDLDDHGDWRPAPGYGTVWFPRVEAGWAPYRDGHWAWIDPWGWTWVDEEPWGYAPFHYGRWSSIGGRWGWVPGPMDVRPVYAPALVVFIGGGGAGFGANVGWFPLGPREVYVPSYRVSRGYVERVNVSNTTVNTTVITNVYNTTIVHNNTNITNVTYVNRGVSGAVTAVPQRSFASAQPVSRSAVTINARDIASAPIGSRVAIAPTSNSVLGARANTARRVAAPPAAVANRAVIAKAAAPPPPVPFAARQQALAAHPGQPIARQEMQRLRPANANGPAAHPMVKQAPPGKPATATVVPPGTRPANSGPGNRQGNQPGNQNQPGNRPGNQPGNQPGNRQGNQPGANGRPGNNPSAPNNLPQNKPQDNPTQPGNRPEANQPQPNNRPQPNTPAPQNRPGQPPTGNDRTPAPQPNNRPEANQPQQNDRPAPNRPGMTRPQPNQPAQNNPAAEPPVRNDRPQAAQPGNRPGVNPQQRNNRPAPDRPDANRPQPNQPAPNNRQAEPPARRDQAPAARPDNRPQPPADRPQANRPAEPPPRNQPAVRPAPKPRPLTPEEKKKQEEQRRRDEKPPQN